MSRDHCIFSWWEERGSPASLVMYLHFFFFPFFPFYIEEGENESMMDHLERRGKTIFVLVLYWCLNMIVQHVLDMQVLALNGEWEIALILSICFESMNMSDRSVWPFERKCRVHRYVIIGFFHGRNVQAKNLCMS